MDLWEFGVSLYYTVSSRQTKAIKLEPVSTKKKDLDLTVVCSLGFGPFFFFFFVPQASDSEKSVILTLPFPISFPNPRNFSGG